MCGSADAVGARRARPTEFGHLMVDIHAEHRGRIAQFGHARRQARRRIAGGGAKRHHRSRSPRGECTPDGVLDYARSSGTPPGCHPFVCIETGGIALRAQPPGRVGTVLSNGPSHRTGLVGPHPALRDAGVRHVCRSPAPVSWTPAAISTKTQVAWRQCRCFGSKRSTARTRR